MEDRALLPTSPANGWSAAVLPVDPNSGGPVVVKDGRFGLYVTDGEVNASFRSADTIDNITLERAAELLQARRERIAAKG